MPFIAFSLVCVVEFCWHTVWRCYAPETDEVSRFFHSSFYFGLLVENVLYIYHLLQNMN